MSIPTDLDKYQGYLALDDDQLRDKYHLSDIVIERVIRLRALYAYWCRFSSKAPREIVEWDMAMYKVEESQAYDDVHCLKVIMGNLQEASKKFWRWRINQMIEEDRLKAKRDGDHRSVAAMQKNLIKNNLTDKEDTPDLAFDKIVPSRLVPTDDPSEYGCKKVSNLRGLIRKTIKQYDVDIEYTDFEEVTENDGGESSETVL